MASSIPIRILIINLIGRGVYVRASSSISFLSSRLSPSWRSSHQGVGSPLLPAAVFGRANRHIRYPTAAPSSTSVAANFELSTKALVGVGKVRRCRRPHSTRAEAAIPPG